MSLRARVRRLLLPALLLVASACGHSEPFQDPDETNRGPFSPATPIQLTYNVGPDVTPSFLPGDTVVLYSFTRTGGLAGNQCVGALPVGGGTTISESCPRSAPALDSLERYENPVALNDSIIVLVQSSRLRGAARDKTVILGTAPWRRADQFTPRQEFPRPSSSGALQNSASYLSLIGGSELAYLGMTDAFVCPPGTPDCKVPTPMKIGREVARLDLQGSGGPVAIPGTDSATAVATGRSAGAILFTLPFDSRVYERLANGSTVTLFDFGSGNVARDPMVAGSQLAAIVGDAVEAWTAGPQTVQVDPGGIIALVNLSSGQVQYLTEMPLRYKRPVLSANGHVLIAEGADSLVPGRAANLFRFDLP